MNTKLKKCLDILHLTFCSFIIILGLTCKIQFIIGESMAPTLKDGGVYLFYNYAEPQVGDIVSFKPPYGQGFYVKRIVAGPGDPVPYSDGIEVLGEDEFYVLGDNRNNSVDSRVFGPIRRDQITGVKS